ALLAHYYYRMNRVTRRLALRTLSGAAASFAAATTPAAGAVAEVFVSPTGNDESPGTRTRPLKSFAAAQKAARKLTLKSPVTVWHGTAEDSGSQANPVTYAAFPGDAAVLSRRTKLSVNCEPYPHRSIQAQEPTAPN